MFHLKQRSKTIFFLFVILLFTVPWLNSTSGFNQKADKVSQESITFYEINPCKVSLTNFLISNPEAIYQDHYHFRFNNYSSVNCFGKISGATVIDSDFYISVGTNSFINLILQGSFWVLLLSRVRTKKDSEKRSLLDIKNIHHNIATMATSLFYCFSLYSEKRFYEKNLYYFNFDNVYYKLFASSLIFLILSNLFSIIKRRINSLPELIPYLFLFGGVFSGFNFSLYASIVVYFGVLSFINREVNRKINRVFFVATVWWIINSTESYYFTPGKLRGFTSSVYEFHSSLFWSIFFILFMNGLWYIFKNTIFSFNYQKFVNNSNIVSISILSLGFLGANFPIINFFNYYYLGLQRFGITRNNPFAFDSWSEKLSWRGLYPSAESIGEFFGLCLLMVIYSYYKKRYLNSYEIIGSISSALGLYFSDNRTVMILVFLFVSYLFLKNYKYKKLAIPMTFVLFIVLVGYLIGFQQLTYSYDFLSSRVTLQANYYQYDTVYSSFILWINDNMDGSSLLSYMFGFFSVIAYFLNRSEIWGIFFARYNPTFMEFSFGTGPYSFGQVYGESVINKTDSFLLPHSSLISFIVFFGVFGIFYIFYHFTKMYIRNFASIFAYGNMLLLFIALNIIKNDGLNYFPSTTLYLFLCFVILKSKSEEVFSF
jgi:hypothetical protein